MRRSFAERFWAFVEQTNGCWLWTGALYRSGYGQFAVKRSTPRPAHRVAWTLTRGEIPAGLMVLHKCDTRHCVRPVHLFLGTAKDNARDMASKGRQVFQRHPERAARGEVSGMAKLTADIVRAIRVRRVAKDTLVKIASDYGVSHQLISAVALRQIWRHVK